MIFRQHLPGPAAHSTGRRRFVLRAGAASLAFAWGAQAQGQAPAPAFPTRAIRLVLPLGPGSANDVAGRLIAAGLQRRLKQAVVVENHPGGGGTIGTGVVAKAPPDGYTIGFGTLSTLVANAALYTRLSFDIEKDVVPIALVTRAPLLLLTNPKAPAQDLPALLAYAKANPGKVTYGSAGVGSINHVFTEAMAERAGVKLLHVPYKSNGPALIGLAGGEVDLLFDTAISVAALSSKGMISVIGAGAAERLRAFPQVPSFAEVGLAGFDASTWSAIIAPRGTPAAIIGLLRAEINAVLQEPEVRSGIERTGSEVLQFATGEAGDAFILAERRRWVPVIRALNLELN